MERYTIKSELNVITKTFSFQIIKTIIATVNHGRIPFTGLPTDSGKLLINLIIRNICLIAAMIKSDLPNRLPHSRV